MVNMICKSINVNEQKWDAFRKWCVNNNTTIKVEIDKFLNQFVGKTNGI